MPEDVVQLNVRIPKAMYEKLIEIVKSKTALGASMYGKLKAEVQTALASWIFENQEKPKKPINPSSTRTHKVLLKILNFLHDKHCFTQAPRSIIEWAIGEACGTDKRTVAKWWPLLFTHGLLKEIDGPPGIFEVVMG